MSLTLAYLPLPIVFVRAGVDAVDVGGSQEARAAERIGSDQNARGFDRHCGDGLDVFGGAANRDKTVILHQNDLRVLVVFLDVFLDALFEQARERDPGVYVLHIAGRDAAADDLIREEAARNGLAGLLGAEDGVDGRRVGVSDEMDVGTL
jgi:hypothetical protein